MVTPWTLVFTKQALKDAKKIEASHLKPNAQSLLRRLAQDPYAPPFKALVGDLSGAYSRRINIQHRLVYQLYPSEKTIKILRMWSHYDEV
ncbi:MAG: Txe/YoeB family addiction module toxin [Candidatus Margulisiibacteriota bacterium]